MRLWIQIHTWFYKIGWSFLSVHCHLSVEWRDGYHRPQTDNTFTRFLHCTYIPVYTGPGSHSHWGIIGEFSNISLLLGKRRCCDISIRSTNRRSENKPLTLRRGCRPHPLVRRFKISRWVSPGIPHRCSGRMSKLLILTENKRHIISTLGKVLSYSNC